MVRPQGLQVVRRIPSRPLDPRRLCLAAVWATLVALAPGATLADTPLNDRTDDGSPAPNQVNPMIATNGIQAVAIWYETPASAHLQYAFSGDGGASFIDLNVMPAPAGGWRWTTDFEAACNARTNEVWVSGQIINTSPTHDHGLGVVRGVLSSSGVAWDPPMLAASHPGGGLSFSYVSQAAMAVDTADGSLHAISPVYTDASGLIDLRLEYIRSTNGGVTWSAPVVISPPGPFDGGNVSLALAGNDILATWFGVGSEVFWTRSSNDGASWSTPRVAFTVTGAGPPSPHNRNSGFRAEGNGVAGSPLFGTFAFTSAEGWVPQEPFPSLTTVLIRSELEPNDLSPQAAPFAVGDALIGGCSSGGDVDCWSFPLTAGQSIRVWQDSSVAVPAKVALVAPGAAADTVLEAWYTLASVSDASPWVFTAPVSGTYLIKVRPVTAATAPSFYRLRTRASTPGPGEARDQHDVAVRTLAPGDTTWSAPRFLTVPPVGYAEASAALHFAPDGYDYIVWGDASLLPPGLKYHMRMTRGLLTTGTAQPPVTLTTAPCQWDAVTGTFAQDIPASGPERILVPWNDARFVDADVRAGFVRLGARIDYVAMSGALPGESLAVRVDVRNNSDAFPETPVLRVAAQRGWPEFVVQGPTLAPQETAVLRFEVPVPDSAAPGTQLLTIRGEYQSGVVFATVSPSMKILGCDTLFALPELGTEMNGVYSMAATDLNNDSHLDLLVAAESPFGDPVLAWGYGDGEGNLVIPSANSFTHPRIGQTFALVDYFADGLPDVFVGAGNGVSLLRGVAGGGGVFGGTFTSIPAGVTGYGDVSALAGGDFNEDGIPDIAVGSVGSIGDGAVRIILGTGTGGVWSLGFNNLYDETNTGGVVDMIVRDLNEDGVQDLVLASVAGEGRISVMLGSGEGGVGSGLFAPPVHYSIGSPVIGGLASGDFNEDGILDIVAASSGLRVLFGNGSGGAGDGTLSGAVAYDAGNAYTRVLVEDLTNDGRADLIGSSSSLGAIVVFAGGGSGTVGDGTFAPTTIRPAFGNSPGHLVLGDYFEDGVSDLLASSPNTPYITILRGLCPSLLPGGIVVDDPGPLPRPGNVIHTPVRWLVGSEQEIAWTSGEAIQSVEVDVSRDGGAHWESVASHYTKNSFEWTVTGPTSSQVVVRVRDSSIQSRSDQTTTALEIIVPGVGVESAGLPRQVAFSAGAPNPFSRGVQFQVDLPADAQVLIELFDIACRRTAVLASGQRAAGSHVVRWNGNNDRGQPAAAGMYFARARIGDRQFVRRLVKR